MIHLKHHLLNDESETHYLDEGLKLQHNLSTIMK